MGLGLMSSTTMSFGPTSIVLPDPQQAAHQYKYLAVDIMSQTILYELPVTSMSASLKLNAPGELQVSVQMEGLPLAERRDIILATEPNRTAIYVERNGNLLGGWIIYKRDRTSNPMELIGSGLLSLFDPLFIRGFASIGDNLRHGGLKYTNVDQLAIVRDLVAKQFLLDQGTLPIELDNSTSGQLRTIEYDGTELISVGEAITELSEMDLGFDYAIDAEYTTDGNIRNVLRLGYPRRGRPSVLNLDYPGDKVDAVTWQEDGSDCATHVYVAGSGEGSSRAISYGTNDVLVRANYPRRVLVRTYSTEKEEVNLDLRRIADTKAARAPVVTPSLRVLADTDPPLGSYLVGDDVRLRLSGPGFPAPVGGGPGLIADMRITEIKINPPQTGAEYVDLVLADIVL